MFLFFSLLNAVLIYLQYSLHRPSISEQITGTYHSHPMALDRVQKYLNRAGK